MSLFTRTNFITGGTSGLGYECALQLAQQQPNHLIIIASRSDSESAAVSINKTLSQSNVQYLPLDLSSLAKIRQFVRDYETKDYPPIQALILNAAIQIPLGITYSEDGFEKTFATNHVGHALLFHLLSPKLTDAARIVVVSSGTHDPLKNKGMPDADYTTAEELAHPPASSAKDDGRQRYVTSKLCNVLWMYALDKRIKAIAGKRWTVTSTDPGLMPGTGLARDASAPLRFIWHQILPRIMPVLRFTISKNIHSPKESGTALARLATGEDLDGVSAAYFEGTEKVDSSVKSHNVETQDDLWKWTLEAIAKDEQERRVFEQL